MRLKDVLTKKQITKVYKECKEHYEVLDEKYELTREMIESMILIPTDIEDQIFVGFYAGYYLIVSITKDGIEISFTSWN